MADAFDRDEPTRPGTPDAKRASGEYAALIRCEACGLYYESPLNGACDCPYCKHGAAHE